AGLALRRGGGAARARPRGRALARARRAERDPLDQAHAEPLVPAAGPCLRRVARLRVLRLRPAGCGRGPRLAPRAAPAPLRRADERVGGRKRGLSGGRKRGLSGGRKRRLSARSFVALVAERAQPLALLRRRRGGGSRGGTAAAQRRLVGVEVGGEALGELGLLGAPVADLRPGVGEVVEGVSPLAAPEVPARAVDPGAPPAAEWGRIEARVGRAH